MSGPRPLHLYRRAAMYAVRFRVPVDLVQRLGASEFARSLGTPDPRIARRMAADASIWFRGEMERLRVSPQLNRADLNRAAEAYLAKLKRDCLAERAFDPERRDEEIAWNLEVSRDRLAELEKRAIDREFDGRVENAAKRIVKRAGAVFDELAPEERTEALILATQAEAEQMRFFIHSLTDPTTVFAGTPSFPAASPAHVHVATPASDRRRQGRTLQSAVDLFLDTRRRRGLVQSTLDEQARALGWLIDAIGAETSVRAITAEDARGVRDGFERFDTLWRGKKRAFGDRQTSDPKRQIAAQTAARYWAATQAFFAWLCDEQHIERDPSTGLKVVRPLHKAKRTPEAFSDAEVEKLLRTPLYAGHKRSAPLVAGLCHERGSYWWTGLIGLFTGMRAGEIAQLEQADFDFASRASGDPCPTGR